jgi:hypothetical protein
VDDKTRVELMKDLFKTSSKTANLFTAFREDVACSNFEQACEKSFALKNMIDVMTELTGILDGKDI